MSNSSSNINLTPNVMYSCSNNECKKNNKGNFNTLEKCISECKPETYSCYSSNSQCNLDTNGKFPSLKDCINHCNPKYRCKINLDGSTDCIISQDGKFNSLKECQNSCKPKFTCDPISYTCVENDYGNFSSITECNQQCNSLLISKEKIRQKQFNRQLNLTNTITGSLESEKLRYNSIIIEYFLYGAIVITVLALTYYYFVNNSNSKLQTIIAIIIGVLVLFTISRYIYNHIINAKIFRIM